MSVSSRSRKARNKLTSLQHFVAGQCKTELRRRSHDTGWSTLEEGLQAFLLPDRLRAITETVVGSIALARLDLKTCLDDVARCSKVGSGHTGDGTGSQHLNNTELLLSALAEVVLLQMAVCWEVDGGEGHW